MSRGVSVIVCCHNSSVLLWKTLSFLSAQEVPSNLKWELILVDNNSSDNTDQIALESWKKLEVQIPIKVVKECEMGLSFARRAGVRESSYDTIIFCDDDNWLQKDYIRLSEQVLEENPRVAIVGGKSDAFFETQKPAWFDSFQYAYVVGKQMEDSGIANGRKYLTGAGMVVRKSVFEQLEQASWKFILEDRKGKSLSSGGDTELCLLAMFLGHDLYYDQRLHFTHFIASHKLNWKYCVSLISYGFAISQIFYYLYDYCYKGADRDKKVAFYYVYKRNIRKPFKELYQAFKDHFILSLRLFFFEMPGSVQQVQIKAAWNKLIYVLFNRKRLKAAFDSINTTIENLKKIK